jgi:hypothetical protein
MPDLNVHLYLNKQAGPSPTSIHLHLNPGVLEDNVPTTGNTVDSRALEMGSGGWQAMTAPKMEQRIRPKIYDLRFVPLANGQPHLQDASAIVQECANESIKLELASGNQINPILWESFAPDSARGLWRFCVRRDFDRFLGTVTHARDTSAIWFLSEWSPRGALILEPMRSTQDPRIMLVPVAPFQV